jgi:hypothetical protein
MKPVDPADVETVWVVGEQSKALHYAVDCVHVKRRGATQKDPEAFPSDQPVCADCWPGVEPQKGGEGPTVTVPENFLENDPLRPQNTKLADDPAGWAVDHADGAGDASAQLVEEGDEVPLYAALEMADPNTVGEPVSETSASRR